MEHGDTEIRTSDEIEIWNNGRAGMCTSHETVKMRNGGREIWKSGETETRNGGAPEHSPTDSHPKF